MKRILILIFVGLFLLSTGALAAPDSKVIGDARSIDTKYTVSFNVNLEKWFAAHPVEPGKMIRMEPIFQTPRITIMATTNKGQLFDLHYHNFADEISFVIKGQCEKYVDGKWVLMNPGDVHYNPRGVIHATRVVGDKELLELMVYTPSPPANDRVFLNSEITTAKVGAVVGDWSLLDTQYKKGAIFNLDAWYATHPIEAGKTMRIDPAMGTLRSILMISQMVTLGTHYHGSIDEMIYVYKGVAEFYINGEWVKVYPGEMNICPRGTIHGMRPVGEGLKLFAVQAPPPANMSDRIFIDLK